jgi:hypothetical protein
VIEKRTVQNLFTVTGLPAEFRNARLQRKFRAKKSHRMKDRARSLPRRNFLARNVARKFLEAKISRHENGRAYDEDAAETSRTRRSEIRAP